MLICNSFFWYSRYPILLQKEAYSSALLGTIIGSVGFGISGLQGFRFFRVLAFGATWELSEL